jgi:hypothetical protein
LKAWSLHAHDSTRGRQEAVHFAGRSSGLTGPATSWVG